MLSNPWELIDLPDGSGTKVDASSLRTAQLCEITEQPYQSQGKKRSLLRSCSLFRTRFFLSAPIPATGVTRRSSVLSATVECDGRATMIGACTFENRNRLSSTSVVGQHAVRDTGDELVSHWERSLRSEHAMAHHVPLGEEAGRSATWVLPRAPAPGGEPQTPTSSRTCRLARGPAGQSTSTGRHRGPPEQPARRSPARPTDRPNGRPVDYRTTDAQGAHEIPKACVNGQNYGTNAGLELSCGRWHVPPTILHDHISVTAIACRLRNYTFVAHAA